MILRKFPQSLGKHHDSADLSIQIPKRNGDPDGEGGRILAPDESVMKILTEEYPNGQKSTDAWTVITTGGRDNYTRWWLQTGGLSTDIPIRPSYSPNPYIPSTGGSYGSEMYNQEYFPYIPQTVVTPPGEFPPRSRASGSSMMSAGQFPRTQGRPPLRPSRTTALQEGLFPQRRYDATGTSSLVAEIASAPDSEHSQQGRGSPDPNILPNALRYPPNIRANNSTGRNTPPGEYPTRARQYTAGKQPPTSAPFQTQPPVQPLPAIPQKPQSPLGGPPPPQQQQQQLQQQQQRLSTGTAVRPTIISSPNPPPEKPPQQKDGTSPKSPVSGTSSNSGGTSNSPVTRRKSNTISNQPIPIPRSPSPVAERTEPRPIVPLVQAKVEKELPTANKTSAIGVIPPINVLIVEDNFINAQILEAFFRKRKLKYATAVNGKEAVEKWRQGGWHLVLVNLYFQSLTG
jgi:osomolarity two-component system response regulator SSK1